MRSFVPCSGTLVEAVRGDGGVRSSREEMFGDVPLILDFWLMTLNELV